MDLLLDGLATRWRCNGIDVRSGALMFEKSRACIQGFEFWAWGSGFGVWDFPSVVGGLRFVFCVSWFVGCGLWFRVYGSGVRASGLWLRV